MTSAKFWQKWLLNENKHFWYQLLNSILIIKLLFDKKLSSVSKRKIQAFLLSKCIGSEFGKRESGLRRLLHYLNSLIPEFWIVVLRITSPIWNNLSKSVRFHNLDNELDREGFPQFLISSIIWTILIVITIINQAVDIWET